jgi:hypothetical protein
MHPYRAWPFLSEPHHPVLSAMWAVLVHGVLSLLVVLPIVWRSDRRLLGAGLAFMAGFALDLDHPIVAGSLSPRAMEHLGVRPASHSLLFAVAVGLAALAVTRRRLVAWSVFAVLTAHLLFDAAGGSERWLFPLAYPRSIPWLACPVGLLLLTTISARLARDVPSLPDAHPVDQHPRRELGGSVR